MKKTVTIAHGNGGEENNALITKVFYKHFENEILAKSEDAAVIYNGELAFTTDSFTVSPLFSLAEISASWQYAAPVMTWR